MIRRPVYAGEGAIGVAVASWLAGALPIGRGAHRTGLPPSAPQVGIVVTAGDTGCLVWDAARCQPVIAIDASGEAWLADDVSDEQVISGALIAHGYRRGEMRVMRRVVSLDGGATVIFRATQWTTSAVRAASGDPGATWK